MMASTSTATPSGSTATLDCTSGVAPGFAEHLLHQFRSSVGDLWLIGKRRCAVDEDAKLYNSLDSVERAQRRPDLGEQHDSAAPRRLLASIEVNVLAEPPFDQAAVFGEANLSRDVEQTAQL